MPEPERLKTSIFFLGRTELDPEMLGLINTNLKRLAEKKQKQSDGIYFNSFSFRGFKKFHIAVGFSPDRALAATDFTDIVDYDPVRDSALALGRTITAPELPLHWLIYRAFPYISFIANLKINLRADELKKIKIDKLEVELKNFRTDTSMGLLPIFRDNNALYIENNGILFYTIAMDKLVDSIMEYREKIEKPKAGRRAKMRGVNDEGKNK